MRLVLLIILLWKSYNTNCDDGFVAIWAPKNLNQYQNFNITFLTRDIPEQYVVGIEFRENFTNLILKNDEFITVFLGNSKVVNVNKKISLAITLYSNKKGNCSTKQFFITPEPRSYYTFIQTDKPIYKPGDEIKFRVLVIDRKLKPLHMNNIKVDFIDPQNRVIQSFDDLETQHIGVFENSFKLSTSTVLGDWKIQAVVDKKEQFLEQKSFSVQKYVLPLFEVQVETDEKNYLIEDDMGILFYAKYSFGEFVTGNAEFVIRNINTEQIYLRKTFENVVEDQSLSYNIKDDFKLKKIDEVNKLEAIVKFTEPQSGITFNKSTIFYVHKNPRYKIVPLHPPTFIPGTKFELKVLIKDYKDEQVMDHDEDVVLKFTYVIKGRTPKPKSKYLQFEDGYAKENLIIPKQVIKLNLEIKFANSETYSKEILSGAANSAIKGLLVDHTPLKPKLHDIIKVHVKGESEMDKLFVIVSSNNGNVQSEVVDCNDETSCEFHIVFKEEMMPHSTVNVYHVKDKLHIYQGYTKIGTEELTANNLKLDLSTNRAKTKDKVRMNFSTSPKSTIYMLAFDKRLKFLRDGNDITRDDVASAMSSYDSDNQIIVNDLSSWTACTGNEVKRIQDVLDHEIDLRLFSGSDEDFDEDFDYIDVMKMETQNELRQDFPESWIFDSFETGDKKTAMKEYTAPDSITTWLISAFSLNKNQGLAMASAQELKVMNDFFVELNLPYSIKFKEVLKLDILVFNYVESKDDLDVDIQLENANGKQFQFVEYSKVNSVCTPIFNNNLISSKSTKVSYTGVKKVSFYIRSNILDKSNNNIPKELDINVRATARTRNGKTYEDQVLKKLLVEPVGIRDYSIVTEDHVLNGEKTKEHSYRANYTDGLTSLNVIVGGDYLGNAVEMSKRFQLYPHHCLEQQTSRIKGNVEYFRYLKSKNGNPDKTQFSNFYQSLLVQRTKNWSYSDKTGYRAYFLEAMASAMEIGALPYNEKIIKSELDVLKTKQNRDGGFTDFGSFPEFDRTGSKSNYFETAFILIPFLKLRKTEIGKKYENQITNAFKYLKSNRNNIGDSKMGLALAAYAFGLAGETIEAKNLLDELQSASVSHSENKKCFKIKRSSESCDMRHTSYAALAYLAIDDISNAAKLVNWLVKDLNLKYLYSNTHEYAVATEPIAKIATILKVDNTDIKVTVKNERNFTASASITKKNADQMQFFEFPEYSQNVISFAEGHGYCSITTLYEHLIKISRLSSSFSLTVTPKISAGSKFDSKIQICAQFNHPLYSSLVNVIYEVEMPSGYVYAGIDGLETKYKEIKLVQPRRKGSLVFIYYNDFERNKQYCVDVKATRSFEVMDIKPAGVKVYDYNDKTNIAIEFYSASNPTC
ncbi:CD109 antigen-like [Chironomus tepperi]|uniref:CD109 antigen-like n=1 Tax=Chironomus tepperi TaxID=113505 RepID=UPI00391FB8A6